MSFRNDAFDTIPHGGIRLIGFVLLALAGYLTGAYLVHHCVGAALVVGMFTSVRLTGKGGWTQWMHDYWHQNVVGYMQHYKIDEKTGELTSYMERYERALYNGELLETPVQIIIRKSGWWRFDFQPRVRFGWHDIEPYKERGSDAWDRKVASWIVVVSKLRELSDRGGPYIFVEQSCGSRARLHMKDALRLISANTTIRSNAHHYDSMISIRPFTQDLVEVLNKHAADQATTPS